MLAAATFALLTGCGGTSHPATAQPSLAASMAHFDAPVADCEAEGCNRPRVVDGLAEQFRASAITLPPAEPVQAAAALQAGEPALAANETAPGAAIALR